MISMSVTQKASSRSRQGRSAHLEQARYNSSAREDVRKDYVKAKGDALEV